MNDIARKKSPRAPSIPLGDAVEAAIKIYDREHRHAAPTEAVAQHLGYKSANNGAALRQIASIRYYGLLERPADGQLAVSKDVESYRFAPSPEIRSELVRRWLTTPPVFAELLEKYKEGLPSDQTLRYDLIQRGFLPDAVDGVAAALRKSVEFAQYYSSGPTDTGGANGDDSGVDLEQPRIDSQPLPPVPEIKNADRIPIRLPGNRRAYVEIPSPFYAADKERIKRQIDLLLTEEDERLNS
jgi:hypothetical protein